MSEYGNSNKENYVCKSQVKERISAGHILPNIHTSPAGGQVTVHFAGILLDKPRKLLLGSYVFSICSL
jgi:hypothetical protein